MESIMNTQKDVCYLCGRHNASDKHHVFNGAGMRTKSEQYGLTVYLCRECHSSIHVNAVKRMDLKRHAQERAMKLYGWSMDDWLEKMNKNYL